MSRKGQYRNDSLIKELGSQIRAYRMKAGISQQQLADICDLELSQINRIELGKVNTSVSQLVLIARSLNVPASKLLDDIH